MTSIEALAEEAGAFPPGRDRNYWAVTPPALARFAALVRAQALEDAARSAWSSKLQCGWSSWSVVDDGILRLDMPAGNCCDMNGAIKIAEAVMPMVWRIDTYSGGKPDTMYVLRGSKWRAVTEKEADMLFATYPAIRALSASEG